jgi:hypothetical protein
LISIGKCFFVFFHPSFHHLFSLVGRWAAHESHARSKNLREEMMRECIVTFLISILDVDINIDVTNKTHNSRKTLTLTLNL